MHAKENGTIAFCTCYVSMMLNIFLAADYPVFKVQTSYDGYLQEIFIHTPRKFNSGGGFQMPKSLKKGVMLNQNFQRG